MKKYQCKPHKVMAIQWDAGLSPRPHQKIIEHRNSWWLRLIGVAGWYLNDRLIREGDWLVQFDKGKGAVKVYTDGAFRLKFREV